MCYWAEAPPGKEIWIDDDKPVYAYKLLRLRSWGELISPHVYTTWPEEGLEVSGLLHLQDGNPESKGIYCHKRKQDVTGYASKVVVRLELTGFAVEHQRFRRDPLSYPLVPQLASGYRAMRAKPIAVYINRENNRWFGRNAPAVIKALKRSYPSLKIIEEKW